MKFHFFTISALAPEQGQDELNRLCAQQRVVAVEKQFVSAGGESFWSLCVTCVDSARGVDNKQPPGRRERLDYKEVLSAEEFAVYAELRTLRKALAEQEGVPAYALFTNEQLAEMVTRRVVCDEDLGRIDGVGKARIEKYGATFLDALKRLLPPVAASVKE